MLTSASGWIRCRPKGCRRTSTCGPHFTLSVAHRSLLPTLFFCRSFLTIFLTTSPALRLTTSQRLPHESCFIYGLLIVLTPPLRSPYLPTPHVLIFTTRYTLCFEYPRLCYLAVEPLDMFC